MKPPSKRPGQRRPSDARRKRPESATRTANPTPNAKRSRTSDHGADGTGKRRGESATPRAEHGIESRRIALRLIDAVLVRKQSFDDALATVLAHPANRDLPVRDRAFARLLAATVLRRHGQLTALLTEFLDSPLPREADRVNQILLLAAAQLMFLGSPPHAVINTAVDLCKAHKTTYRFRGLVNAVLRRVSERGGAIIAAQNPVRLNMPPWLYSAWRRAYGDDLANTIAAASMTEASLDLTVRDDPSRWAETLGGLVLPTGTVRCPDASGRVDAMAGYDEGAWWVQDVAASLPARLFGAVDGLRIADLCAAPGGKTAQLAAAGAHVTAVDISENRLARVRDNLTRLKLTAKLCTADVRSWQPGEMSFDGILLDAPCTATGTIRRHPDIPHLKSAEDVRKLARLQAEMLAHVCERILRPGSVLIFCTCSLQPEEGIDQITQLLAQRPDIERVPLTAAEIGGLGDLVTSQGDVRTLPCNRAGPHENAVGMDGFFISRLRKTGA